jgi:serine/threonine protein kinase
LFNSQGVYEGQTVAVKRLIKPATNENSIKLVNSFLEEATTMQLMKHDRIVKFIFLELETFSLVLEFMPEGTLFSYIQKHRKPPCLWSVRHQLISDVCEGMEFLHSSLYPKREGEDQKKKKVVFHQDLKTQNILLKLGKDKKLRALITDFGLSRMLSFHLIQRDTRIQRKYDGKQRCVSSGRNKILYGAGTGKEGEAQVHKESRPFCSWDSVSGGDYSQEA